MKKWFTLLLLVCCCAVKAQQLTTVEYFYDTDPGIGHATAVALNGSTLDATVNFSVDGLSSGLHILNVRLKNTDNSWSTTYQSGVLISSGTPGGVAVVYAEYFFDNDPGFGSGKQLSLQGAALDSLVNFEVNGLATGAHTLYIRLKNTQNAWSFAYRGNFMLSNGNAGAAQITSLEYFSENDLGIGRNTVIPLNASAVLDTTISIPVADNGSDSSVLGLRLSNQTGQVGNVALNTVSLCDLYKPAGGFRETKYASGYNFIDTARYNPSGRVQWLVDGIADTAYNNSPLYSYNFPAGVAGYKILSEVTGAGCRVDTVHHSIYMSGIESIAPEVGYLKHDYVMNIFGAGFDTSAVIYLKSGNSVIYPYAKTTYLGKLLTATFDLHDVTLATPAFYNDYDLHVHLSNGFETVLPRSVLIWDLDYGGFDGGFCSNEIARRTTDHRPSCAQLVEGEQTFITTDLTGSRTVKTGVWNYYTVNATNVSGVLAKCPVIWIMVPANNDAEFDVDYYIPAAFNSENPLPTEWIPIDTVINGTHHQYKLYSFIPAYIAGDETRSINFKLRSTVLGNQDVYVWAQKPQFGSPWKAYWACTWDVLGYVPLAGCFTSVYDWTATKGNTQNFQNDGAHGNAYNAGRFFASYWYNTTGAILSCSGGKLTAVALGKTSKAIETIEHIESTLDKQITSINNDALNANGCWKLDYKKDIPNALLYVGGFDPNHLTGNSDYDNQKHFISNLSPQHYEVGFENLPAATGNAQHVYITDTLDASKYDFTTFRYTGYRIGDSVYTIPPFRGTVYQTLGMPGRSDMQVLFVGSFDTLTGIIRSDFFSMNAAGTKVIADTSLDGFLPPNLDGVSGTGSVQFQVAAKDLNTLDTFRNVAHVYFDNNQPIRTNSWMNTVDTTSPSGRIVQADRVNDTTIKLTVQKGDVGSGFWYNQLYGKTLSDTVFHKLGNFTADTVLFTGDKNAVYQFYTKAVDHVGNEQVKAAVADITYSLSNAALPVHLLSFTATKSDPKVKLQWTVTNEVGFSHYVAERSADGSAFTPLATVTAKGGSLENAYLLYDERPLARANYYRLKMVDKDGSFTYSRVVRIDFDKAFTLALTPVPAQDYIVIDGAEHFDKIQLIDLGGRVVKQFGKPTVNKFNIAGIPAGVYLVRLISGTAIETLKMVKE